MDAGDSKEILEVWLKTFEHMDVLVKVLKDKLMHKSKMNLIAFIKVCGIARTTCHSAFLKRSRQIGDLTLKKK
jgi:hypothetical protein